MDWTGLDWTFSFLLSSFLTLTLFRFLPSSYPLTPLERMPLKQYGDARIYEEDTHPAAEDGRI
jgi:hypothetical protein